MERMRATDLEMLQAREKSDLQLREAQQKLQAIELQLESSRKAEEVALHTQEALRADVQRFNQIAEDARDNYQRQVVELSDAIQARQKLESECNQLKEEIRAARDEAVIANAKLNSAEETWDKVKLSLEEQVTRAENRVEDLSQQNRMLYAQLDRMHVSQQPAEENLSDEVEDNNKRSIQDLTGLNQALRGERDSLRDKLAISTTDNERLRLQLSVVERDLDECRARLEEHSRSQTTGLEGRHQELIEKVEQANLFRESNITLRAQLEQSAKRNAELESKLSELKKELDPLRQQVSDLVLEVDAQKAGNTKLAEDNKYWKARVDQILQKYQRVDPHEYEALKEQVAALAAEKSSLESANSSLLAEVSSLEAKYSELEESLRTQIKAQEGKFSKALEVVQKQKAIIQNKAKEAAEKDQAVASKDQQVASLTEQVKKLHEQLADLGNHEFVVGLRTEYEKKHRETVTKANATLARFKEEQKNLRNEVRNLKQENEALQARIATFDQAPDMQATTDVSHLQHRITELEAHTEARIKEALDAFKMKASAETIQQTTSLKSLRDELAREKQKTFQLDVQLKRLQSQQIGTNQSSAPTAPSPEISRGEQAQVSSQPLSEITISPAKRSREDDDEGGKGSMDTAVAKGAEILEAEHKDKKLKVGVSDIEHAPLKPTSPRQPQEPASPRKPQEHVPLKPTSPRKLQEHAPLMPISPQQPQEHVPLMPTNPRQSQEQSRSMLHPEGNIRLGQSAAVEMEREESLEEGQVSEAPDGDAGRTPMEGIVETGTPTSPWSMPPGAEDRMVEPQQHAARTSETEQAHATSMEKPGSQVNAASEDQPESLPVSPRIRDETGAASAKHDTLPHDPAPPVATRETIEESLPKEPAPTLELASAPLLSLPAPAIVTTGEENSYAESVVPPAEVERPSQVLPSEIATTAPVASRVLTATAPMTQVPSIKPTVTVPTNIVAAAPITAVEPANAESRAAFLRQQLLNRMKGGQSPAPQPQAASIPSKLSAQAISQPETATVSAPQALSAPQAGNTTLPGLQIPSAQKVDIARVAVTHPPPVPNPEEPTAPVLNPNTAPEMPATSEVQPSVTGNSEPGSQTPPAAPGTRSVGSFLFSHDHDSEPSIAVTQASHMTRSATGL
ncbi:TPR/MLP1/MLP2-like protein-domain-containing protein [Gaertneriomyces semiglobifer]|nr:TPR/MLP1/MLP2-like protein-domain-containing protein [Gaertneriomyces semiglobifer]